MRYICCFFLIVFVVVSCKKPEQWGEINTENQQEVPTNNHETKGLYVVCEGNFGWGNSSISYYNKSERTIINDLFNTTNNRPLGDVAQSAAMINGLIYIVVNNSGKIEIVEPRTLKAVKTIAGLASPRYVLQVSASKAFVSHLYQDSISVVDLIINQVVRKFKTNVSAERLLLLDGYVYANNWLGNKVLKIDPLTETVVNSLTVAAEPNSMVVDKNKKLWVMCSGGYQHQEYPELVCIEPISFTILKTLRFPDKNLSPLSLDINNSGDILYYINKDIYRMAITDTTLPATPFIKAENRLFYSLSVDKSNNDEIYILDAVDYQQKGIIYRYQSNGLLIDIKSAGIIPSYILYE